MEPFDSSIERAERLGRRQFEDGEDIFAVQWSGIHRMAQTGDIRGLRYVGQSGRHSTHPAERRPNRSWQMLALFYLGRTALFQIL